MTRLIESIKRYTIKRKFHKKMSFIEIFFCCNFRGSKPARTRTQNREKQRNSLMHEIPKLDCPWYYKHRIKYYSSDCPWYFMQQKVWKEQRTLSYQCQKERISNMHSHVYWQLFCLLSRLALFKPGKERHYWSRFE
jgi:hypothetical protein